jgi:hypothetical protein
MSAAVISAGAVGQIEAFDERIFRAAKHETAQRIEAARVERPIVRPLRNHMRLFRIKTVRHGGNSRT